MNDGCRGIHVGDTDWCRDAEKAEVKEETAEMIDNIIRRD